MTDLSQEDLSQEARAQLRMAKVGFSPQAADRERVHAAVAAAVGVSAGISAAAATQVGLAKASSAQAAATQATAGLLNSALLVKGLLVVAVVGGLSGAVGYKLGYSNGLHAVAPPASSPASVPPVIEAPTSSTMRATPQQLVPTLPIAPPAVPPTTDAPAQEPALKPASRLSSRGPTAGSAAALPDGTSPESEEILQLERVQRALRDGYPALALAILGELDHKVPRGMLIEERTAAKIIARCSLGETSSAQPTAFVARYPKSMYLGRIARACSAMNSKSSEVGTEIEPAGQE